MKLAVFALLLVVLPFRASSYVCDTLIVQVMRGFHLPGDFILGDTDGYVKAIVDGQTKQTHVIHDNQSPIWKKDLTFTNVKSNKLRIEVWDEDGFLRGDDDRLLSCDEVLKPGSYATRCGYWFIGEVQYGLHCLKGDMKRKPLTFKYKVHIAPRSYIKPLK